MRCEKTSDQWPYNTCYTPCRTRKSGICCSLRGHGRESNQSEGPRQNSASSKASQSASNNEGCAILRNTLCYGQHTHLLKMEGVWFVHTTNQTPYFENNYRNKVSPFQRQIFVCLSPCGLERRQREEQSISVPANRFDAMEFIGDFWDGSRDNCL
jgi:hypothetical protein